MLVNEILSEQDFKVTGDAKSGWKIIGPGGIVDTGKYRGEAERKADRLNKASAKTTAKSTTKPVDDLKSKANTPQDVDRTKGEKAADKYLDKKGVTDKTPKTGDTPKKPLLNPDGKIIKTMKGVRNFATAASGGIVGSLVFMFLTYDTLKADLRTFAAVYELTGCKLRDPRMNKAQTRFGDRLTSNVMATCLALVATGMAIKTVKKILMVLRAGALFAGPAGWIGYLISWVGAEAAIYGTIKMLEAKWFHAAISDYMMNNFFTKRQIVRLASGFGIIGPDHPCYQKSVGFIRNEAVGDEDQNMVFETVSKAEIKSGIKDIIVNDPKMMALMKKAKRNKEKGIKAEVT